MHQKYISPLPGIVYLVGAGPGDPSVIVVGKVVQMACQLQWFDPATLADG